MPADRLHFPGPARVGGTPRVPARFQGSSCTSALHALPGELANQARSAIHALPRELPNPLLPPLGVVLHVDSSIDVCRRIQIRVDEHGDDTDEDAVHAKDWPPTLIRRLLLVEAVRTRWVEDGDAHPAIRVDVGVPHVCLEPHLGRVVREVRRERQHRAEDATLEQAVRRALEDHAPFEEVRVVVQAHGEAAALVLHELNQLTFQQFPRHMGHCACRDPGALPAVVSGAS
mmetsp:Transcript_50793/g.149714  ORF Transcript_50793/g.149714 Transcript_50793/m.149714 type:complete len:230 (+) Transcript_50793:84-773(+)